MSVSIRGRQITPLSLVGGFFVMIVVKAWLLMLVLGMIAGYTGLAGLAIGFWATLVVLLLLNLAFDNPRSKSS